MKNTDSKKLDQIIAMLGDVVDVFGKRFDKLDHRFDRVDDRFDKLDDEVAAVKSKVEGINRRLDTEAMQRTDLKLPRRMHEVEEKVYGTGRSKHPKHVPL